MRPLLRRVMRVVGLASFLFVLACFPFGPLFAWSPWKPGYDHLALASADIYFPSGTVLPAAYRELDHAIRDAQEFHELKAPQKIRVVLCRSWSDYERFAPWVRSRGVGAITLATGDVIFVTPKIDEMKFDHGEYLRHELSHAVIHQNQRMIDGLRLAEAQWLLEGIAVWFGRQKAYKTREEFLEYARTGDLATLIDPARRTGNFDIRMGYPAWRYFNTYLDAKFGRNIHREYLKACMKAPRQWRELFASYFRIDFEEACRRFQDDIKTGTWLP